MAGALGRALRCRIAALNGSPLQSDHALPSTFFSLLSTFETIPPKRHYLE